MKPRHAALAIACGCAIASVAYCAAVSIEHDRILADFHRRLRAVESHFPAEAEALRRELQEGR